MNSSEKAPNPIRVGLFIDHTMNHRIIASMLSEKCDVVLADDDIDVAVVDSHCFDRTQGEIIAEIRKANKRAKLILYGTRYHWVLIEHLSKADVDSYISFRASPNEIYYGILDTFAGRKVRVDPQPPPRPTLEERIAMLTPDDIQLLKIFCCQPNPDRSLGKRYHDLLHYKLRIETVHEILPIVQALNLCADT